MVTDPVPALLSHPLLRALGIPFPCSREQRHHLHVMLGCGCWDTPQQDLGYGGFLGKDWGAAGICATAVSSIAMLNASRGL